MPSDAPPMLPTEMFIGKCIYCDSTEALSNEHILPEGLGGRDQLLAASCEVCRVETCRFEGFVQQKMLYAMRIRLGIKGKRKHPDKIPILVTKDDGQQAIEQISPDDVVMAAMLPVFTPPGILLNAPRDQLRDGKLVIYGNPKTPAAQKTKGILGETTHHLEIISFARMIAKIAHAGAVHRLGLDGFEPFLCPIIREARNETYYFVGSEEGEFPPPETAWGSWMTGDILELNGARLVVMRIRLLAQLHTPVYQVITGRLRE